MAAVNATETDWKTECLKADRDFPRKAVEQPTYEFSNDRKFKTEERPNTPYRWNP